LFGSLGSPLYVGFEGVPPVTDVEPPLPGTSPTAAEVNQAAAATTAVVATVPSVAKVAALESNICKSNCHIMYIWKLYSQFLDLVFSLKNFYYIIRKRCMFINLIALLILSLSLLLLSFVLQ
jgi:hypothetical protein